MLEGREKDTDLFEILKINKNAHRLYVTKSLILIKFTFYKEKSLEVLVALLVIKSNLPKYQINFYRI